jgi:tripartite-type tricarboxylate transporter receptor subunit TctC
MKKVLAIVSALFFFSTLAPAPATPATKETTQVQTAGSADFYKGKTIKILVGFSPGNSSDLAARVIARYLAKQTDTTVVVVNDAGGGGLVARNALYSITKPDGLTIMCDPTGALWPSWVLDQAGVAYDISKFEYLGGIDAAMMGLMVSAKGPYKTIDDLRNSKTQVKFAASGVASLPSISTLNAIDALGLNAMMAAGYKSSVEFTTAIAQREADAGSTDLGTALRYQKDGTMKVIAYLWYERDKNFPDVPSLNEFIKIPDKSLNLMKALSNNGKIFFAPPNTPADRVQYLRNSLTAIFADNNFQAEIVKLNLYWPGVISGEDLKKLALGASQGKTDSVAYYKSLVAKYVK